MNDDKFYSFFKPRYNIYFLIYAKKIMKKISRKFLLLLKQEFSHTRNEIYPPPFFFQPEYIDRESLKPLNPSPSSANKSQFQLA